jgi:hypothetical protein
LAETLWAAQKVSCSERQKEAFDLDLTSRKQAEHSPATPKWLFMAILRMGPEPWRVELDIQRATCGAVLSPVRDYPHGVCWCGSLTGAYPLVVCLV